MNKRISLEYDKINSDMSNINNYLQEHVQTDTIVNVGELMVLFHKLSFDIKNYSELVEEYTPAINTAEKMKYDNSGDRNQNYKGLDDKLLFDLWCKYNGKVSAIRKELADVYNLKYSWNGIKSRIDKMGLNDFSF
jgi:hypothetical protein